MAKKAASKMPEICLPGGMCYRFPPPCCSICCTVFSLFSMAGLFIIYALINNGYTKISGQTLWNHDQIEDGKHASMVGAFIYLGVADKSCNNAQYGIIGKDHFKLDEVFSIKNEILNVKSNDKFRLINEDNESILIRKCYKDLFNRITDTISFNDEDDSRQNINVLITGNPGIGKTYFSIYSLSRLLKESKKNIVYQSYNSPATYIFPISENENINNNNNNNNNINTNNRSSNVISVTDSNNQIIYHYLMKKNSTILITDSKSPVYVAPCFVLLISSSLNLEIFKIFIKNALLNKFFMPTWSKVEIDELYKLKYKENDIYGNILKLYNSLFIKWGGYSKSYKDIDIESDTPNICYSQLLDAIMN
ncbi:hypothetical protein ACTFIW_000523 [Dictyostelium discoideum]